MSTITPVELDRGETLSFTLRDGRVRTLKLLDTFAAPLITNLDRPATRAHPRVGGKTIYHFGARVEIDGHSMTLQRYVGVQETFHEPYVVNGMRIWLDGVAAVFRFMTEQHGPCRPGKAARFVVQDAGLGICPERVVPWYPNAEGRLRIEACYGGDDPWMGAYAGEDAHGGLDVDMPEGTPLVAPISFDFQHLAHAVARGDGNNRWEGWRRWPDGSTWVLGVAHVASLAARERTPLARGSRIGLGAGMAVGYIEHSHFNFRVVDHGKTYRLDPWIIFWEAFRSRARRISMRPPDRARTGRRVAFRCDGSRRGLAYAWTFGDGGSSAGAAPVHVFARRGIYPVTLTVDDGRERTTGTCHLTVDGEPVRRPALVVAAPGEVSFRPRPAHVADTYGVPPASLPHTVEFTAMSDGAIELHPFLHARERRAGPNPWVAGPRRVLIRNAGGGRLAAARVRIRYELGRGWLAASVRGRSVVLAVNPRGLPGGAYRAIVEVAVPGAVNSPQAFRVRLRASARSPFWHAVVDDLDPGCVATPGFWIAPRFPAWWPRPGHGGRALFNGGRAAAGEFVRYTPFLWGGTYDVMLGPDTPVDPAGRFQVRVRHRGGTKTVWLRPARSRRIGTFVFRHGTGGWVEIRSDRSEGQVAADAVFFIRVGDSPGRTWDHGIPSRGGRTR